MPAHSLTDQPVYTEPRFRLLRDCWDNRIFRSYRKGAPLMGSHARRGNAINWAITNGLARWDSQEHNGHPCKRLQLTVDGHALMLKWKGE